MAKALCRRAPAADQLAALGFLPEDLASDPPLVVWPDNAPAVDLFCRLQTQWQIGPGGVVGLRYEALPAVFDLLGARRKARARLFADLQVMESAALGELNGDAIAQAGALS